MRLRAAPVLFLGASMLFMAAQVLILTALMLVLTAPVLFLARARGARGEEATAWGLTAEAGAVAVAARAAGRRAALKMEMVARGLRRVGGRVAAAAAVALAPIWCF
jgi:hypothetical protein